MTTQPEPVIFTLEQANAALEVIRPLVEQILQIRERLLEKRPLVWPVLAKAAGNGGSQLASQVEVEFERLDRLVRQVRATGAVLKDINTGLVDFPALRDGQMVFLCWKFGEPQVLFWHEVDDGFAGRRPV